MSTRTPRTLPASEEAKKRKKKKSQNPSTVSRRGTVSVRAEEQKANGVVEPTNAGSSRAPLREADLKRIEAARVSAEARACAAEQRAEQAEQRAVQAVQRAEQAEQRAAAASMAASATTATKEVAGSGDAEARVNELEQVLELQEQVYRGRSTQPSLSLSLSSPIRISEPRAG
jgi:hypothetical protein